MFGSSYHFSDVNNFVKENFEGVFDSKNKTVTIQETGPTTFHVPPDCIPCIKRYTLAFAQVRDSQTLSGDWGGRMMNSQVSCPPGKIILTKEASSIFNEIKVDTGNLRLDFYDNAEIDGDSISLFLNGKLIFEHINLTEKAYVVKLAVSDLKETNELIMVAENLGEIPPNTSYMVAIVGDKRYDAQLASTENSSAMIKLKKEEPPHLP